jgi:uncharacterized protein (DUF2252 family)
MLLMKQASDRAERVRLGRTARKKLPRRHLARLPERKLRRDPVEVLEASDARRLERLLPVKYARMSLSPFAFFRGSVAVMASDLSLLPHTECFVQLCGDAHVQNLGWFETPDGRIVFDLNDFDETIRGPWEWDVKRMATSIVLAGHECEHGVAGCTSACELFLSTYCDSIASLAKQPILVAVRHQLRRLASNFAAGPALEQAKRATPLELLNRYTIQNGRGKAIFLENDRLWRIHGDEAHGVLSSLSEYRKTLPYYCQHFFDFFRVRDAAFKIVGTGSVGLRDYIVLMEGNGPKDPLFLQIKQEVTSTYQQYLGAKSVDQHGGRRVADGQRRIQPISDLLLGWTSIEGHDYLVRQLNDHKGTIDMTNLRGKGLSDLAIVAGRLLARGHARSGDALAIASYIGSGDRVIRSLAEYAKASAENTIQDFGAFHDAIKHGVLKVAENAT